jgi:CRISPR-associated protein Csm1
VISKETVKVATATLVHDLGKIWQRAGRPGTHADASAAFVDEFRNLFPAEWVRDIHEAVGNHHQDANNDFERIIKIADWLASAEREEDPGIEQSDPAETPLLPVSARVEFREERPQDSQRWGYRLTALQLDQERIFPAKDVRVSSADYQRLWADFESELRQSGKITDYFGLISFLALLRKYASFVPSSTPWETDEEFRTLPDISLYDHLKVTAAVAACLARLDPEHIGTLQRRDGAGEQEPVAQLLRADFSGIQNFLYRIARAEQTAEFRNTSKRLRGRSFFLALLADVTADWLTRELNLSPANILFCGGGRFDLLIGADGETRQTLSQLEQRLQRWLVEQFHGELGLQLASVDVCPADFEDLNLTFEALNDNLATRKQQKFRDAFDGDKFFVATEPLYHVCNYCRLTSLTGPEAEPCASCYLQRAVGGKLPRTEYLAYLYGRAKNLSSLDEPVVVDFTEHFGVDVVLLEPHEVEKMIHIAESQEDPAVLYHLNDTNFLRKDCPSAVSCSFKFLGNEVPRGRERIDPNPVMRGKEAIGKGDILDFDEIASMSSGAQLLGVLKADVDYLGQVFGLGLKSKSISRIATLSSAFDLFFSGWINRICEQLAATWHTDSANDNRLKGRVDGLFYVVYSSGDDLLILGPWDALVDLACEIHSEFRAFTCYNENITLSGGVLLVKPHFPIQRFAQLAGEQLEKSKTVGQHQDSRGPNRKDRITLFGDTVPWDDARGFLELVQFAKALEGKVKEDKLPRSFIYFLLQLHRDYIKDKESPDLYWLPRYFYALARRVANEVIEDLGLHEKIPPPGNLMQHIRIPTSYVSLKIRRE